MYKVKIYEIKSGAAVNAPGLLSPDGKYFYWDNAQFSANRPGDKIFVVNITNKWALFTEIRKMDILATYNATAQKSTFNNEFNSYTVEDPDGRYKIFIQFSILQKVTIPVDWRWTTQLGMAQTYDLWRDDIVLDNLPRRKEKVHDLMKLFPENEAVQTLNETLELLSGPQALNPDIVAAVKAESLTETYTNTEFHFLKAQQKLEAFETLPETAPGFFADTLKKFNDSGQTYSLFLSAQKPGDPTYILFWAIGELVSYCDLNAARKNEFNEYPDKRTLALALCPQNEWTRQLLQYKIDHNNINALNGTVYNAIQYLKDPEHGITMLSDKHRAMVSRYLLKQAVYNKQTLTQDLIEFFKPYNITPVNSLNQTRIISNILYFYKQVKKLWFEKVEGLVVCDSTAWFDRAINDLTTHQNVAIWWDKIPSGGKATLTKLRERIKENNSFYIYYTKNQIAYYRSRIVDFATDEDYASKQWNTRYDVAGFHATVQEYIETKPGGKVSQARIVFLADQIARLKTPIPISQFTFYADFEPPTQNNMQPYAELVWEDEEVGPVDPKPSIPLPIPVMKENLPTAKAIPFDHLDRSILTAIKTKPFILLAGLSGTGKSRLVRKLAYHTCNIEELQGDKPGNFLLIPVRPNWHDSMEIIGYVSRISGKPEYIITPFIRFLAKAWQHPDVPFFICLDEMNLAPVEQYFAEFLSLVETRQVNNGSGIITDPILSYEDFKEKELFDTLLDNLQIEKGTSLRTQFEAKGISLPRNLIVMGTVNMDETTHSFSRKVLDRAMTFEINNIDLKTGLDGVDKAWQYPDVYLGNELLFSEYTIGGQVYTLFPEAVLVIDFLEKLNEYLDKTAFKVAYRVRDEFLIYCYHNSEMQGMPDNWLNQCLDELTLMKVLSRLEGDHSKVEKVLSDLIVFLDKRKYPKSASKLAEMKDKLEFGYTTYW